jgi:bifunctional non-homologous end joining protein LigD
MLWDVGTWTPEVEDVNAALKKGDLKFQLNGVKLKGSWVLVRTGGRFGSGGQRSWLLIKHRDEWSGELDIAEFAPLSVKSGGDFPDILASDNPDIWQSNRPASGGETGAMLSRIIEQAAEIKRRTAAEKEKPSRARKKAAGPARGPRASSRAKSPARKRR